MKKNLQYIFPGQRKQSQEKAQKVFKDKKKRSEEEKKMK
jgi:hypothetical protein